MLPPPPLLNQLLKSVHCFCDKSNCHAWDLCCVYFLMILHSFYPMGITRLRVEYQLKIILQMQNHHPFHSSLQIQHSTRSMHLTVSTTKNHDTSFITIDLMSQVFKKRQNFFSLLLIVKQHHIISIIHSMINC